jgi:DNA-binding Lrp family transcriptional regulator
MDITDMNLILLLLQNSRLSYAELADKLNLSVNAVHKRIQQLIETDVIHKFTAKVSLPSSQGLNIYISGTSQIENPSNLPDKLRTHGSIYWLAIGSAKFLYVGALIRNIAELEPLISYIKKEVGIPDPKVGIIQPFPVPTRLKSTDLSLCTLDYRIINALKDDARRKIADVANELGISTKTVRRRLDRMVKNNLIELSLEWYPDKSDDITTVMEVKLKPEFNAFTTAYQIQKKYAEHILFFWDFANLTSAITFIIWTNSMGELYKIHERLEKEPEILSAVPYVLCKGYIFENWRDRLAQTMLSVSST